METTAAAFEWELIQNWIKNWWGMGSAGAFVRDFKGTVVLCPLTFSLLQLLRLLRLLGHQCGLVGERLSHQAVGSRVGG